VVAPKKAREWPIATIAFVGVLGTGLVVHGLGAHRTTKVEDEVSRTFTVGDSSRLLVETFNGPIDISRGGKGQVECTVVKRASGADEAEARGNLRQISVALTQEGDLVRVVAHRAGLQWDLGASVRVRVPDGAAVTLRTSNGKIVVRDVEGPVDARATNGRVEIHGATGPVALATTNGPIACEATDAVVTADTSNGGIDFRGTLAPGRASFRTTNGRVTLKLPESQAFHLDARTTNGKVSTDFDIAAERDYKARLLIGTVGQNPMTDVKVRTTNGSVRIVEDEG
jgi:hypothetical protein